MALERVPMDMQAYVRRITTGGCFICALQRDQPADLHEIVYSDDDHIAFLSRYPTMPGYVLVSPRRHVEHIIRDLSAEEYLRLQAVVYRVATAVERVTKPERTYVLSLGSQQANAHIHWHIAPLPTGVPFEQQQFHALMAAHGVIPWSPEQATQLADRIRAAL